MSFSICFPPFEVHSSVHLKVIPTSIFLLSELLSHMSKLILIQNYFVQVQWYIFYSSAVSYCFVMFTCLSDCARIFFVQTFMTWYCSLGQSFTNGIKKQSKHQTSSESVVASCFQLISSSKVLVYVHTCSSTVLWNSTLIIHYYMLLQSWISKH